MAQQAARHSLSGTAHFAVTAVSRALAYGPYRPEAVGCVWAVASLVAAVPQDMPRIIMPRNLGVAVEKKGKEDAVVLLGRGCRREKK